MKFGFICLLLTTISLPIFSDDPPEFRALYAATFEINTEAKCKTIVDRVLAGTFNAIFVEARGRADAYYYPNREDSTYPNIEPRSQSYPISPSDFDPLQYFIDRLHNATPRREVHAWVTTYPSWNSPTPPASPQHIYNAHPEWITENKAGVTYTHAKDAALDPGIPAVQEHLFNTFMDIIRNYDVDGFHFDYVRLSDEDSGYDPVAKAQFLAQTGWNYDTQNTGGALDEAYKAWRRDQIAKLVQRVHRQTKLEKPWVVVSAFLIHFDDPVEKMGQGYNWWVAHNAIDVIHGSCYSDSVSGNVSNWNGYITKLKQNGDENKIPLIAAIGDYLLKTEGDNAKTVEALRANARKPDGFNFFSYGSVYEGSLPHSNALFNAGGVFANWAPIPIPRIPGEETIPPNPPAALTAALVLGVPQITFQRPAAAADGDLPIHYRVYRGKTIPVPLTYSNMLMEWWDLSSSRTTFSVEDKLAGAGTWYYAAVAYDDWNNQAVSTSAPVTVTKGGEYIIETGTGGKNISDFSIRSGVFFNSTSHSLAPGCTASIPSKFSLPSDGKNDIGRFTPSGLASGTYNVYTTCFNYSSANAPNITVRVYDKSGTRTSLFNLTQANCGNKWTQCATMNFSEGSGHYIEFDSSTQSTSGNNDRMNPAAVRFLLVANPPKKELKPKVSEPPSNVVEVIVDSEPTALDYDDNEKKWMTTTYGGEANYYNGSARYFAAASYPMAAYAIWIVDLPRAGWWAIDGYIRPNQIGLARGVQYRFVDGSGIVRNVTATQQTGSGGWTINVDGVADKQAYFFKKGRVYVTLYGNTTGSELILADAIRFRLIKPLSPFGWMLY